MDDREQAENENVLPEDVTTSPVVQEDIPDSPANEPDETPTGEAERKPTRAERRIRDFSEKTRRLAEENEQLKSQLFSGGIEEVPPNVFNEGETEIDPQELQKRMEKYVEAKVTSTLRREEAIRQQVDTYKKTYEDHQRDLEAIVQKYPELDSQQGGNPELERQFCELFDKLNAQVTPDGRKLYQPKVKASEVAEMIFGIKKAVSQQEVAEFTGKTVKQEMERAISPTGERPREGSFELEDLKRAAKESGSDEAWAQYFKRAGFATVKE